MAAVARNHVVAVDLGGTKILAAVVDTAGRILCRTKAKTPVAGGSRKVLATVASCVRRAIKDSGIAPERVRAVGIGVPGPLDPDAGIVKIAPNLRWENVAVKDLLEKRLSLPVHVENDVNAGTVGEHRLGAGVGVNDLIGIFVGTGIGGGLVFNGRLHHGFGKVAGEIGHMIIEVKGPRCGCGNRGCFEALASRTAIVRDLAKAIAKGGDSVLAKKFRGKVVPRIGSRDLAKAFQNGDKLTVKVIKRAARRCGVAVASLLNLLNPEMVILGGGVVEALGTDYVKLVAEAARKRTFDVTFENVRIVPALLGDDAVLLGAACVARDRAKASR